jgi:hypothetical protein
LHLYFCIKWMRMSIKVNHADAKKLEDKLGKEEWQLTKQLRQLQARKRLVSKIIADNDEGGQSWIIEMPVEALETRKNDTKVNWKKLVCEMFELYQIPMSTELMCHKLWLHYPEVGFDRRAVMQNVSAALSALESRDQKLFRTSYKEKKGFIYGQKHFFDFDLRLKPYYFQQWKREEGEPEAETNLNGDTTNVIVAGLPVALDK